MLLFIQNIIHKKIHRTRVLKCHDFKKIVVFFIITFLLHVPQSGAEPQEWIYTTRPGDTLWNLSQTYLKSMAFLDDFQKHNQIDIAKKMRPGTRLRFPIDWLKIEPVPVRVIALSGVVSVKSATNNETTALKLHALLHIKDEVLTGSDGSVGLRFADGSQLIVLSDSHLIFDVVKAYGETGMVDTRLRLQKGRLDTQVKPQKGAGSRFEIHTPGAISAVRGTELRVVSENNGQVTRTEVLSGLVKVGAAGETLDVPEGFGTVVPLGKAPSPPKKLLPSPDLSGLTKEIVKRPDLLKWPVLEGALAYRIQIAPDADFMSLLIDQVASEPQFKVEHLENGQFTMRVRGIDSLGLEGANALHDFVVAVLPVPSPPDPLSPLPNVQMSDNPPTFQWNSPGSDHRFHFQLSQMDDFSELIADERLLSKSTFTLAKPMKTGQYYWRVAVGNQKGVYSPFSEVISFRIGSHPSLLTLNPAKVQGDHLLVQWGRGKKDEDYQFELAKDEGFKEVIFNLRTSDYEHRIVRPDRGVYYMRVRAISADGTVGEFSEVRSVDVPCGRCWALILFALTGLLALL